MLIRSAEEMLSVDVTVVPPGLDPRDTALQIISNLVHPEAHYIPAQFHQPLIPDLVSFCIARRPNCGDIFPHLPQCRASESHLPRQDLRHTSRPDTEALALDQIDRAPCKTLFPTPILFRCRTPPDIPDRNLPRNSQRRACGFC